MSELPQGRKLVKVEFWYDDDTHYRLDAESARNFQNNIHATGIMAARGHKFLPVVWKEVKTRRAPRRRFFLPNNEGDDSTTK